jgi:hypothetical protein
MTQASTLMFQFIPSVRFPAISYFKRAAVSTTGSGVALETPCLVCLRHRLKLSWLYGSITPDFFPRVSASRRRQMLVVLRWRSGGLQGLGDSRGTFGDTRTLRGL